MKRLFLMIFISVAVGLVSNCTSVKNNDTIKTPEPPKATATLFTTWEGALNVLTVYTKDGKPTLDPKDAVKVAEAKFFLTFKKTDETNGTMSVRSECSDGVTVEATTKMTYTKDTITPVIGDKTNVQWTESLNIYLATPPNFGQPNGSLCAAILSPDPIKGYLVSETELSFTIVSLTEKDAGTGLPREVSFIVEKAK